MGWTYDLARLHATVKSLVPPGTSFHVALGIWDHNQRDGSLDVEVAIWDHGLRQHFVGSTPAEALAALRAHYDAMPIMPEDLGLVAMPEGRP